MKQRESYDYVHQAFHWSMSTFILAAVALGLWSSFLAPGTPLRLGLMAVHKSFGFMAAALILPRIGYRLISNGPAPHGAAGRLTHMAAQSAHVLMYALMLFMPITGYVYSAAGGYPLSWFGLLLIPRILEQNHAVALAGKWLHDQGALFVYAVIILHISAVAWHHFFRRDDVLKRMLPIPQRGHDLDENDA